MTEETQVNEAEEVIADAAVETVDTTAEAPANAPASQIEITANDLATMVRIIDAGSQRGTFRGEELAAVGILRNKLAAAVNALAPQKPVEEEKTEEAAEEAAA